MSELVELAAIVRGHALAGEMVLKLFNPDSELLESLREVVLRSPEGVTTTYQVRGVRGAGAGVLITLQGVDNRDQADALRGSLVCVSRDAFPPLEEGEYYLVDLPGLKVRDAQGNEIGVVEDVLEYPSVPALAVNVGGEVREVPDLPRYLLEVRVSDGYVVVDNLDELEPVQGKR